MWWQPLLWCIVHRYSRYPVVLQVDFLNLKKISSNLAPPLASRGAVVKRDGRLRARFQVVVMNYGGGAGGPGPWGPVTSPRKAGARVAAPGAWGLCGAVLQPLLRVGAGRWGTGPVHVSPAALRWEAPSGAALGLLSASDDHGDVLLHVFRADLNVARR